MGIKRLQLVMVATVLLAACSVLSPVTSPDSHRLTSQLTPAKSPADRGSYRFLTLGNGLRVMLVSDPSTDRAAASLQVAAGSANDPSGLQGMAHFLEHLLFLGTDRYPDADDYQSWLKANGGRYNAYTAFEFANYFFEVPPDRLAPTLDRFSRFFIAPRLDPEYVSRELEVVAAEYQAGLVHDLRRRIDVLKTQVNQRHPWAKFAVGNKQSLVADNLAAEARKFFDRHYRAGNMTLTVAGSDSLDELQQLVVDRFSQISAGGKGHPVIETPLFAEGQLPVMIRYKSLRELQILTLSFVIPDVRSHYRSKPLQYIGDLIGHEGPGSLLASLKKNNLATALFAGRGLEYTGGGTFDIDIELTRDGLQALPEVISSVFGYIELLRQKGPQKWYFEELRTLAAQQFEYQEQPDMQARVMRISHNLHFYPPDDVLRADSLIYEYNPGLIEKFLNALNIDNCFIMLPDTDLVSDSGTQWYNTPYRLEPFPVTDWHSADRPADDTGFALPQPNTFIATDLHIFDDGTDAPTDADVPQQIYRSPVLKVWHYGNGQFLLPRADTLIRLTWPFVNSMPADIVQTRLLASLLNDSLAEKAYPALLAGLGYSVVASDDGLQISLSGYSQHQPQLMQLILAHIEQFTPDPERFDAHRRALSSDLRNAAVSNPVGLLMRPLQKLLSAHPWSESQLADALMQLDRDDFIAYSRRAVASMRAEMLIVGNIPRQRAGEMAVQLQKSLPVTAPLSATPTVLALSSGQTLHWQLPTGQSDTAVILYLQAENGNWRQRSLMALSAQLLNSDFFHQLRTERQLGYIVFSQNLPYRSLPGSVWVVQSPSSSAGELQKEIQDFFERSWQRLEMMSAAEFNGYREALIRQLAEKPKTRSDLSRFWWRELQSNELDFGSRKRIIAELRTLVLDDLHRFFRQYMYQGSDQRRAMWLSTVSDQQACSDPHCGDLTKMLESHRHNLVPAYGR